MSQLVRIPRNHESVFRGVVRKHGVPVSDILQVWLHVSQHPSRGKEQADLIWRRILSPALQSSVMTDQDPRTRSVFEVHRCAGALARRGRSRRRMGTSSVSPRSSSEKARLSSADKTGWRCRRTGETQEGRIECAEASARGRFQEEFVGEGRPPVTHYHYGKGGGFYAEFLAPLEGSEYDRHGKRKVTKEVGGESSQLLRYIDILLLSPWEVALGEENGYPISPKRTVQVANPASFLAQKILIHGQRDCYFRGVPIVVTSFPDCRYALSAIQSARFSIDLKPAEVTFGLSVPVGENPAVGFGVLSVFRKKHTSYIVSVTKRSSWFLGTTERLTSLRR